MAEFQIQQLVGRIATITITMKMRTIWPKTNAATTMSLRTAQNFPKSMWCTDGKNSRLQNEYLFSKS